MSSELEKLVEEYNISKRTEFSGWDLEMPGYTLPSQTPKWLLERILEAYKEDDLFSSATIYNFISHEIGEQLFAYEMTDLIYCASLVAGLELLRRAGLYKIELTRWLPKDKIEGELFDSVDEIFIPMSIDFGNMRKKKKAS